MRKILPWLTLCFLVASLRIGAPAAAPANLAGLRRDFQHPPDEARIMVRWWWFGPSVEKPELEREMHFMKEGGIGGFEVQPVYPLELDNPATSVHNFPYLSDEFLDALRFAGAKAKELGLLRSHPGQRLAFRRSTYSAQPGGRAATNRARNHAATR